MLAAPRVPDSVLLLAVPNLTAILGTIADRFFGAPSQAVRTVGVTGTNGKTTGVPARAATQLLGTPRAYVGTIGFGRIDALKPVTTHDARFHHVHRQLARTARAKGAKRRDGSLLARARSGARRRRAVPTPPCSPTSRAIISTITARWRATARRRRGCSRAPELKHRGDQRRRCVRPAARWRPSQAVGARRDAHSSRARRRCPTARRLVRACSQFARSRRDGLELAVDCSWGVGDAALALDRRLQCRESARGARGAARLGHAAPRGARGARALQPRRPGRMETFGGRHAPLAVVDYAHTPDALRKALAAARAHSRRPAARACSAAAAIATPASGRSWARSPTELADDIVITDDNPRSEDPAAIVADIVAGIPRRRARSHRARSRARDSRKRIARGEARRRRADRRQGSRGLPDLRHGAPPLQRPRSRRGRCSERRAVMSAHACASSRDAAGGSSRGADCAFTGVSTDTRTLKPGALFVALRGAALRRQRFRRGRRRARRGRRRGRTPRRSRRCRRSSCRDTPAALTRSPRAWRATVRACRWSASPAATARPRSRK